MAKKYEQKTLAKNEIELIRTSLQYALDRLDAITDELNQALDEDEKRSVKSWLSNEGI